MLHSISWNQYLLTLLFLGLIYYIVIAFRFYKWEILKLLGIEKTETGIFHGAKVQDLKNIVGAGLNTDYPPKTFSGIDISDNVAAFADEVKAYTKEANTKFITRDEMIEAVTIIASKYPLLRQNNGIDHIEEFITNEINTKYPKESFNNAVIKLWN